MYDLWYYWVSNQVPETPMGRGLALGGLLSTDGWWCGLAQLVVLSRVVARFNPKNSSLGLSPSCVYVCCFVNSAVGAANPL